MSGQQTPPVGAGFMLPKPRPRRIAALTALITTAALVLSISVAATAVSIGISRAAPSPAAALYR